MKLKEKLYPIDTDLRKTMEKQFIKDNINVKKNWSKGLLHFFTITDDGDTFLTIFNKNMKKLYSSAVIFNEIDIFNEELGRQIAVGRMCKNTDFINSIRVPEVSLTINGYLLDHTGHVC